MTDVAAIVRDEVECLTRSERVERGERPGRRVRICKDATGRTITRGIVMEPDGSHGPAEIENLAHTFMPMTMSLPSDQRPVESYIVPDHEVEVSGMVARPGSWVMAVRGDEAEWERMREMALGGHA